LIEPRRRVLEFLKKTTGAIGLAFGLLTRRVKELLTPRGFSNFLNSPGEQATAVRQPQIGAQMIAAFMSCGKERETFL
jgi:hypothetical protein